MVGIASLCNKPKLYTWFLNSKGFQSIYRMDIIGKGNDDSSKRLIVMMRANPNLHKYNQVKIVNSRRL